MSILSFIMLLHAVIAPNISAPQLGAEAAVSAAMVIIPYVFTRAVEAFYNTSDDLAEQNDQIINLLVEIRESLKK